MEKRKRYVIGNWKSNLQSTAIVQWFADLRMLLAPTQSWKEILTCVVCPPFPYLSLAQHETKNLPLPLAIGAQDISPYETGSYTGEVAGVQLREFAQFVLIGHSERRNHFHETDAIVKEKVARALTHGLEPIVCVPDEKTPVPQGVRIVAYEPVWAIGTGTADTPENAGTVAAAIRNAHPDVTAIVYGGSVTEHNIAQFLSVSTLDGVLPGKASLTPSSFLAMMHAANDA